MLQSRGKTGRQSLHIAGVNKTTLQSVSMTGMPKTSCGRGTRYAKAGQGLIHYSFTIPGGADKSAQRAAPPQGERTTPAGS